MSGIFGILRLDGGVVEDHDLRSMQSAMRHWGPDGSRFQSYGQIGFGQCVLFNTPEAVHEALPSRSRDGRFVFTAAGRVDNREELLDVLGIPPRDHATLSDGQLLSHCYERWGHECPARVIGDWSIAAYDLVERVLFVARDHHGKSSLYFVHDRHRFALASDRRALLTLPGFQPTLNERYLAKVLTAWPGHGGSETVYRELSRLPPAHALRVSPQGLRQWQYWRLEEVQPVTLSTDDAYVEAFNDVFTKAVSARLRSLRPLGMTLSAGLDSGAIAATAAGLMGGNATGRLTAFTMAPIATSQDAAGGRLADEWPVANSVASRYGITHVRVADDHPTPIEGVRRALTWHGEPTRTAGHQYGVAAYLDAARMMGVGTLLDGHVGNATISWRGEEPWLRRLWRLGGLPVQARWRWTAWRQRRGLLNSTGAWLNQTPIRESFVRRLQLADEIQDLMRAGAVHRSNSRFPYSQISLLQPGQWFYGAFFGEYAAHAQLETRDPTADVRVIEFTFAIPNEQFHGPSSRWLIRRAMEGKLPDAVRFPERRGLQSADVCGRLRMHRDETQTTLADINASLAAHEYLDLKRMRDTALRIERQTDLSTTNVARTVLLRGISAGLFLRGLSK